MRNNTKYRIGNFTTNSPLPQKKMCSTHNFLYQNYSSYIFPQGQTTSTSNSVERQIENGSGKNRCSALDSKHVFSATIEFYWRIHTK